jgi:membrane protein YdbS with pleckstrin-like domain
MLKHPLTGNSSLNTAVESFDLEEGLENPIRKKSNKPYRDRRYGCANTRAATKIRKVKRDFIKRLHHDDSITKDLNPRSLRRKKNVEGKNPVIKNKRIINATVNSDIMHSDNVHLDTVYDDSIGSNSSKLGYTNNRIEINHAHHREHHTNLHLVTQNEYIHSRDECHRTEDFSINRKISEQSDVGHPKNDLIVTEFEPLIQSEFEEAESDEKNLTHIDWYTEYSLTNLFPTSHLFTIQKSITFLFIASVSWILYLYFGWDQFMLLITKSKYITENTLKFVGIKLTVLLVVLTTIYWELYRRSLRLSLRAFRFEFTRGVFWKVRGSLPLMAGNQVYIKQSPLDMLFGLYKVHILVPGPQDENYTSIEGLSYKRAQQLNAFLTRELNKQVFLCADSLKKP